MLLHKHMFAQLLHILLNKLAASQSQGSEITLTLIALQKWQSHRISHLCGMPGIVKASPMFFVGSNKKTADLDKLDQGDCMDLHAKLRVMFRRRANELTEE